MFLLVLLRVADLLTAQRRAGDRERALREAGASLVVGATEPDATDRRGRDADAGRQPYRPA